MLYKNEEPYKLNSKEIDALVEHFHGKFPVRILYPPDRVVPSRNKHNRMPDKPNSISFDLKAIVKTPNGTEVWRYADSVLVDAGGKKKFTPKKLLFTGARLLDRNDIELIFFLYKKSSYCLKGENQGRITKFVFEDLITDAEKKVKRKKIQAKIDRYLYDEDLGLKDAELRKVAKAYFIKGVDTMKISQVRLAIEQVVNQTKDGYLKFLEMVKEDSKDLDAKASITKAMDMDVLIHEVSGKTKAWYWKTKEGKEMICRIPPDKSANEAIFDYYLGNKTFQEDLKAVLVAGDPKAGQTPGNNEND